MIEVNDVGKQQGTFCIDLSKPDSHYTKMTLATNLAIVFTNTPPAGKGMQWIIEFCQDGKGGKTVTFPSSLKTIPKINVEPDAVSAITFYMEDGNNIEARNQTENKIEIEEEDFQLHDYEGISCLVSYCGTSIAKERLQQILQDHKDAEYWHKWVGNQSLQEILDVWKKDRQMIEKIKECLKNVHFTDEGDVVIKQIEDILEENKSV